MSNSYISNYYSTDQIGISFNTGKYMYAFYNDRIMIDAAGTYLSSIGRYKNLSYFMSGESTAISGINPDAVVIAHNPIDVSMHPGAGDYYEIMILSLRAFDD